MNALRYNPRMSCCVYNCTDGLVSRRDYLFRCRCPLGDRYATHDMRSHWEKKRKRPPRFLGLVPEFRGYRRGGADRAAGGKDDW